MTNRILLAAFLTTACQLPEPEQDSEPSDNGTVGEGTTSEPNDAPGESEEQPEPDPTTDQDDEPDPSQGNPGSDEGDDPEDPSQGNPGSDEGDDPEDPSAGEAPPTAAPLPNPRYVLRGRHGDPVEAMFWPMCSEACGDFGEIDYTCINLQYHEQDFIGINYNLKSGSAVSCYPEYASIQAASPFYANSSCTGQVYNPGISYRVRIIDTLYYADQTSFVLGTSIYVRGANDTCVKSSEAMHGYKFWPLRPVPSWVANLMVVGAPYTVEVAY